MHTHMNLVSEAVTEKRIKIEYVHTSKMKADGFTKVLDGSSFDTFPSMILGCK